MSPQFERVVVITIMTILVSLFSWIYLRDRQRRMGLWMLGWVWILIQFAALALLEFKLLPVRPAVLAAIATLHLAGMSFLLSVSRACATWQRRLIFLSLVGAPSIAYTAFLIFQTQYHWVYPAIIGLVISTAMALAVSYYSLKKPLVLALIAPMLVAGVWVLLKT